MLNRKMGEGIMRLHYPNASMKRTTITISPEVYEALDELKWEYHKRTFEGVVRVLLAHEGLEEFEEE
jgi:hypothetical protein